MTGIKNAGISGESQAGRVFGGRVPGKSGGVDETAAGSEVAQSGVASGFEDFGADADAGVAALQPKVEHKT
jgi:hypothetical protein